MAKKIIVVFMVVLMAFSFTACKKDRGEFRSLKDMYAEGCITMEDLQTIADYQNGRTPMDNIPELPAEIAEKIRRTYYNGMSNNVHKVSIDTVFIMKYYGNYNGCYAVMMDNTYFEDDDEGISDWVDIAGIYFNYTTNERIVIWREKP